ncbi:MAG TPA: hypothetical protein PK522_00725 [Nitrosomonas sp.]|nr:hypothetical protein [Nitrosomonas sp.]
MKKFITPAYTFTPGGSGVGTVDLSGISGFNVKNLVAVINQTRGVVIYATGQSSTRYTNVTGTTVTLFYDTTGQSGSDVLQVIYEDNSTDQPVSVSSSALPTGAATSANQNTGNTSLSNIDTATTGINAKLNSNFGASSNAVRVAAQLGNATAIADFAAGNSTAQTLRTVIATNQPAIATKSPVNASGSTVSASISAVTTVTAPANAVEVIVQADDTNTANLRFAVNGTATTTSGIQLQPGRSETLKIGSDISIIPESGTQKYNIIWVTQ